MMNKIIIQMTILSTIIFGGANMRSPNPAIFLSTETATNLNLIAPVIISREETIPLKETQVIQEPVVEVIYEEPKTPIETHVFRIAEQYAVDPYVILAIIHVESGGNQYADNGSCVGLMQINTYWQTERATNLGVYDLYDIESNILVGVDIYKDYLVGSGYDIEMALMAYNGGFSYAESMRNNGSVSGYAIKVLTLADQYRIGSL